MVDQDSVEFFRQFLASQGLDADLDDELAATPERVTELFRFLFRGLREDPPTLSTFPPPTTDPVALCALSFQSMCVHHLLPFFGAIDVAYIPDQKMVGFGSIGKVIDHFSYRPQVQERLIVDIADYLEESLQPQGLLIRLRARQMCMEMRGSQKQGELVSIAGRGCLEDGPRRAELLAQFQAAEEAL